MILSRDSVVSCLYVKDYTRVNLLLFARDPTSDNNVILDILALSTLLYYIILL
jgi:hypothetical protein